MDFPTIGWIFGLPLAAMIATFVVAPAVLILLAGLVAGIVRRARHERAADFAAPDTIEIFASLG